TALHGVQCASCGKILYPPRMYCSSCRGRILKSITLPSLGEVFSFTSVSIPLNRYSDPPYTVALIKLDGIDLVVTARCEKGITAKLKIGQKMKVQTSTFNESGDLPVVFASPVES
ncbi:MAG TPA: OB-fold domain-containing protein, partial [Candidatus Hodarchaeales archaeon]|nr:OB-fold domain-containing protein [Candidatus Hodarchaeales archaeon]